MDWYGTAGTADSMIMFNGIKTSKVNKIEVVLQQISEKFCHHRAIACQSISSSAMRMLWSFMQQCYEDAMVIVRKYGKNAYFITMTCNPQKPQIARKLRTCQTSLNMSHLVSCVLRQYLNAFISDLWENGILGRGIARIHVIEFQEQGYPQTHIVLSVPQVEKDHDVGNDDSAISAEISNREELPFLLSTVLSTMMYYSCGADNQGNVCMRDNECSKGSSKAFQDDTDVNILS